MSEVESPPPAAPAEGVDERYAWPEGTDPEVAGRYKDPVELARAKREQDAAITRYSTEAAEARRELEEIRAQQAEDAANRPWQDPLAGNLPQQLDPALAGRLEMMFARDPQGAYELAAEATPGYGPELQNRVMAAWMATDPVSAMGYFLTQQITPMFDERFQSYEEQLAARLGPTLAHATTQMSDAAIATARSQAPDFGTYETRIEQMLEANPALIIDVMGNVAASADRLLQLRDLLWAQDERQKQLQAGLPATATAEEAPRARPRQATIGNGSAPRPSGSDEEYAALAKASMKGVKARSID